jgi:hypothetical protein
MKLLKIALLLLSINCIAASADIYDELANAIRTGDAHQIAGYFDAKVNLALSNQEDVYSKAQAELLIKDFFSKNPAKSFTLVHKGSSKEGSLFAVGTLTCTNGKSFRVSFVMKSVKGTNTIQELRFENQ